MNTPQDPPSMTLRRRLRRLIVIFVIFFVLPLILIPFGFGFTSMFGLLHPPCADGGTPDVYGVDFREISIPAPGGGSYRGFYMAGDPASYRGEATIIVPPAYAGGRGAMLEEASLLVKAGYNILMYEGRICAGKTLSLGYRDVEDIGAALDYLRANPEGFRVDMSRIALHGYSSAGAASTMAMARYPEVRGAVAEGGYHNLNELMGIGTPANVLHGIMQVGSLSAYRLFTGDDPAVLDPFGALEHIPPRGLFLVYGSKESTLPGAERQLARLLEVDPEAFTALWVPQDADHGTYVRTAGAAEFTRQMTGFYDCALFDRCDAWRQEWAGKP